MALDLGGRHDEAAGRVRLAAPASSAHDGGWHAYYLGDDVEDPTLDTNVTCYVATGVWHHHLVTGDTAYLARAVADGRGRHRLRARLPARDRRDRVARRRSRRRRAAHRVVEHPPQPEVRARHRRAARPRATRLGALARRVSPSPSPTVPTCSSTRTAGRWTGTTPSSAACCAGYSAERARRGALGDVRGRRARRPLRVGPPVGHRGRDVRAGDGARRRSAATSTPASCSRGCSSCATTTAATGPAPTSTTTRSTSTASSTRSSSRRGTRPRSCWRRTRSPAPGPTAGLFRGERLPEGLNADELLAAGVEIERGTRPPQPLSTDRVLSAAASSRDARRVRSDGRAEDAEAAGRRDGREAVGDRALPHLVGRLAAVGRILEHVVEHEAGRRGRGGATSPRSRRGRRRTRGRRRRTPARAASPSARRRSATRRSTAITTSSRPGVLDGAPEERQRVHPAGAGVDQALVVVLPPGLVLLRPAVVVDGEEDAAAPRGPPRRGRSRTSRSTSRSRAADPWPRPRGRRRGAPGPRRRA